jgi:thiol-disulfide isomerase/thioredoxin
MHILHINSDKDVDKVDKFIKDGSNVFILIYMEGCEPCKATRPEWEKIESALKEQYAKNDKLAVIDVNKDYLSSIKHVGPVDGFPTIKYIGSNGSIVEAYESSSIKKKDRSVSSFINWIESKINKMESTTLTSSAKQVYQRIANKTKKHRKKNTKHKKVYKGGKWSKKYKSSINCNSPNGFSQKQYCKYGRYK